MKEPTEIQMKLLLFVADFRKETGYSPSWRDIAEALERDVHNIVEHAKRLRKKGYLIWDEGKSRTIRLTDPRWQFK
jgi:SOS-response transcriptional repressor LexA